MKIHITLSPSINFLFIRSSKNYHVVLVLKAGGIVAVAETCEGTRG